MWNRYPKNPSNNNNCTCTLKYTCFFTFCNLINFLKQKKIEENTGKKGTQQQQQHCCTTIETKLTSEAHENGKNNSKWSKKPRIDDGLWKRYETWTSMAQCREQMQIRSRTYSKQHSFRQKHSSNGKLKAKRNEQSKCITCLNFHEYVDIISCNSNIFLVVWTAHKPRLHLFKNGKIMQYLLFRRSAIYVRSNHSFL